jgi:hypothetical protein
MRKACSNKKHYPISLIKRDSFLHGAKKQISVLKNAWRGYYSSQFWISANKDSRRCNVAI